jgi:hypothetical protein
MRQASPGLMGSRRRRPRLVPGGELHLRVPGAGIPGQRRVTTGRIAPGPAGRAPGSGRGVTGRARVGGAMLVNWLGRAPGSGIGGVSLAGARDRRGAERGDVPRAGAPGLPGPGQGGPCPGRPCPGGQCPGRQCPGGPAIANRRQAPGGGEIGGLVIERATGPRIGIVPGRVGSPPVRRCGDLVARESHVGSVSLCAALNALSGVFPGVVVAAERSRGCPGDREVIAAARGHRRATGTPPGLRAPACPGRPAKLVAAVIALTTVIPGRYPPLGVRSHPDVAWAPSGARHRVAASRGLVAFPHGGTGKVSRPVAYVKVHDCAHI